METKFAPVRVRNPLSDLYSVKLKPTQGFNIMLSDWFDDCEVFFENRYIDLVSKYVDEDHTSVYCFKQRYDLTDWSQYSSFYLGQVSLQTRTSNITLCVIMNSNNQHKECVVTSVNPISNIVKIYPNNILEVVVYEPMLGLDDVWCCDIIDGEDEYCLEQIGYDSFFPTYQFQFRNTPDHLYAMTSRMVDGCYSCKQHHFWFRCNAKTIASLSYREKGIYSVGNLVFTGRNKYVGNDENFNLEVRVALKNDRGNLHRALLCPKKFQMSSGFSILEPYIPSRAIRRPQFERCHYYQPIVLKKLENSIESGCFLLRE